MKFFKEAPKTSVLPYVLLCPELQIIAWGEIMKKGINSELMLFSVGGSAYGLIEILWRRYTHWSMVLTGGVCFSGLYHIYDKLCNCALWKKCVIGGCFITAVEFCVGFIVNIKARLHVWDYSRLPLNIRGQVCLPYSILWMLLCAPVSVLCSYFRSRLN